MEILNILLIILVVLLFFLLFCRYNEKFIDIDKCLGKRDGVSGCRDCCRENFGSGQDYNTCVNNCMRY